MSTPREQYDTMLDDLEPDTKEQMISHVPFAKVLEDIDPIAYRCGCNDFQPTCDECGHEFWADDPDAEAVCPECAATDEDEEAGS